MCSFTLNSLQGFGVFNGNQQQGVCNIICTIIFTYMFTSTHIIFRSLTLMRQFDEGIHRKCWKDFSFPFKMVDIIDNIKLLYCWKFIILHTEVITVFSFPCCSLLSHDFKYSWSPVLMQHLWWRKKEQSQNIFQYFKNILLGDDKDDGKSRLFVNKILFLF